MRQGRKKYIAGSPILTIGIILFIIGLYSTTKTIQGISEQSQALTVIGAFLILFHMSVFSAIRNHKKRKLLKTTINKIAELDGVTFENYCMEHFKKMGYKTASTELTGDYGADIILKKAGETIVVQCKRYKNKVGISAIQEVIGAKGYYKADKAMVVTNSYYTKNATILADANDVELWDKDDMIRNFKIKT